jgi:hypothetical protein
MRRELQALVIALAGLLSAMLTVPGEWLLQVYPIDFVQLPGQPTFVVQRAYATLPIEKRVVYTVEIVELDVAPDGTPHDTVVCRGVSPWYLEAGMVTELRIAFSTWVQDSHCLLRDGHSYYARVSFRFDFFGFAKSVHQRTRTLSLSFVAMMRRPSL